MLNVYQARHKGREFCNRTEGENHYKEGGIEPMDLFIAKGTHEDFCIDNMVKYAMRFKVTRNLKDLIKVSDYAQILCGVELDIAEQREIKACTPTKQQLGFEPWDEPQEEPMEGYRGRAHIPTIASDPKEATLHT